MKFRKTIILAAVLICCGCGKGAGGENPDEGGKIYSTGNEIPEKTAEESGKLAEGYREIYQAAEEKGILNTIDVQKQIVNYMGRSGYISVDRDNRINMSNYEQAEKFCENAKAGEEDAVTIISLVEDGGFIRYDMETRDKEINVAVSSLRWENMKPEIYYYHEFTAHFWKYTEKGYLFIEEYRPPGYDGAPGEIAFRIKPLDQTCRELNEKYVYPVGYVRNNLLITDWSENDYAQLDFYDLYEILYYIEYGDYVPYKAAEGAEYEIPGHEFEKVIQSRFRIDRGRLAAATVYDREQGTYRYRPRGLHDAEQPYEPYPEVTSWEEQEDGTLRLFVEAVWERKMTDQAMAGELVVRPLQDGSFQYVSNQVTSWDEELEFFWYTPRLSDEEWRKWYR